MKNQEENLIKILGIEERFGEFENKPYHNVYFHCGEEFKNEKSKGFNVSMVKVRYDTLTKSFEKELTTSEILSLVGKDVEFYYDKYKNVTFANVFDSAQTDKK